MIQRRITANDAEYPHLLRETQGHPQALYLSGKPLDAAPAVAIVGTRRASQYGLESASWLARELAASGITIVSGMASGIDSAAHRGALESGGHTIAVLGSGLDICFPRGNRGLYEQIAELGTLVSEYSPGTPVLRHQFPERNRIIAGMALGTVIVEARPKGGALITARLSMEFSRDVFAVPGAIHSPCSWGSHALIRDGARLVTSADEVLEDLGMLRSPPGPGQTLDLDPDEARVMSALQPEPLILDQVARRSKMPVPTAISVLVRLEVKGLASRHPGGRYALPVGK
ncbi:MAG: DNA-processing protein DprA [Actinomycetota bacterium]